jgi:hypothetical protein
MFDNFGLFGFTFDQDSIEFQVAVGSVAEAIAIIVCQVIEAIASILDNDDDDNDGTPLLLKSR